jgi:hypothetical protein
MRNALMRSSMVLSEITCPEVEHPATANSTATVKVCDQRLGLN